MDLSHSMYAESENKIYIYDDLLHNESSIRTYSSEEEKGDSDYPSYSDLLAS